MLCTWLLAEELLGAVLVGTGVALGVAAVVAVALGVALVIGAGVADVVGEGVFAGRWVEGVSALACGQDEVIDTNLLMISGCAHSWLSSVESEHSFAKVSELTQAAACVLESPHSIASRSDCEHPVTYVLVALSVCSSFSNWLLRPWVLQLPCASALGAAGVRKRAATAKAHEIFFTDISSPSFVLPVSDASIYTNIYIFWIQTIYQRISMLIFEQKIKMVIDRTVFAYII